MATITEKHSIRLRDRLVTIDGVRQLASLVLESFAEDRTDGSTTFKISADCADGSQFSSEDISFLASDSVLTTRRVEKFSVSYYGNNGGRQLEIALSHGNQRYGNKISISGKDSAWVNGTLKRLQDIFESFAPQNTVVRDHRFLLTTILAHGIGRPCG